MITRRRLLGWSAVVGAAASAAKAFAARLPRLGSMAAQVKASAAPLDGKILYKTDSSYEIQRRAAVWNARKPNRFPNAIVLAESVNDVVAAVKLAKQHGWQVGTRSGGHSFTGSHTRDNAVLINITKMKELSVDAKARIATVSPAWFGDQFNNVLAQQYQLMFPTAHDPGVGLGGFVMCGGHGLNSRLWGPGCANLQALDLVTADGELIHADEKQNSDYLWAARGAGPGFFGVAVRYYLNLHPLPTSRKRNIYIFSPDVFDELAMWMGHTQNSFPGHVEGVMVGGTDNGASVIRLIGTAQAYSEKDADSALAIFESCPVINKAITRRVNIPVTTFGTQSGITPGSRQVLDGVWCSAPPEKILAAGRDAFVKFPTPQSFMLWMHWGPVQKLKDMAYSLQGDVYLSTNAISFDAKDDERCAAWSAEVIGKLKPIGNGSQMNDENMPSNKGPYLSKESAARLEALRKKYDPERRFVSYLT
jgi:FAD/FMN-containing dehydrogenase